MDMLETLAVNDFPVFLGSLAVICLVTILWYYWYVFVPYSSFPAYRLEYRILTSTLTKEYSTNFVFENLIEAANRYATDGMFVLWFGMPNLIAYGEDIVKLTLNAPAAANKPKLMELFDFFTGKGLVTSNGEEWRLQRKRVNPAFSVAALKEQLPAINKHAASLVEDIAQLECQDNDQMFNLLKKCSFRIICEASLGQIEMGDAGDANWLFELSEKLWEFASYRVMAPWLHFNFTLHLFPYARKMLKLAEDSRNIVRQALTRIKESVTARLTSPDLDSEYSSRNPKSFSEIILEQNLTDPSFSTEELLNQIMLFLGAGFDSTACQLKWCLFMLGAHQDVQQRAYEELSSMTGSYVQYQDLVNLDYLDSIIKETVRLYPAFPIFARKLNKDLQFGKHTIPKGTSIFPFTYMLHRNPEIYPDPETFDPGRFMRKDSKIKSWNHMAFGDGIRNCIGKHFAIVEIKVILVHILRNFKIISLDRREDVDLRWSIVLECKKNPRIQLLPRQQQTHQ